MVFEDQLVADIVIAATAIPMAVGGALLAWHAKMPAGGRRPPAGQLRGSVTWWAAVSLAGIALLAAGQASGIPAAWFFVTPTLAGAGVFWLLVHRSVDVARRQQPQRHTPPSTWR